MTLSSMIRKSPAATRGLFTQGNTFVLEDLGSTNGTFVNGQRLMGPNMLRPGDVITFGERMSLVFNLGF